MNITEIFFGKLPDLVEEGFSYETMEINGKFKGNKVIIDNAYIDGSSMDIVFQGEMDRKEKMIDITMLVAPLKTVDHIVKRTPIVSQILNGSLVSIPIKIQGDFHDPKVTALSPSAVGAGLLNIMKNTLTLPVTIIEPVIKQGTEKREE